MVFKTVMKGIPTDGTDAVYSYTSQFFQVSELKNRHTSPALSLENGDSLKTQITNCYDIYKLRTVCLIIILVTMHCIYILCQGLFNILHLSRDLK